MSKNIDNNLLKRREIALLHTHTGWENLRVVSDYSIKIEHLKTLREYFGF